MQKKIIVLASSNLGKIKEIVNYMNLLLGSQIEIVPQIDLGIVDIEETAMTFVENALLKARHASKMTGYPAIADDSGLEVDALNGEPGVLSARYAPTDRDRINKLINALKDVPETEKTARYQAVMVYLHHEKDPSPIIAQGTWEGRILSTPRGEKGFGYDPIFYVPNLNCSAGELDLETKNKISHRGQSMKKLAAQLKELL